MSLQQKGRLTPIAQEYHQSCNQSFKNPVYLASKRTDQKSFNDGLSDDSDELDPKNAPDFAPDQDPEAQFYINGLVG